MPKDRYLFHQETPRSNPYRVLILFGLIVAGIWLITQIGEDKLIEPLFQSTPVPTRTSRSFAEEAQALFAAGDLEGAINTYKEAQASDPENTLYMAELARIQVYSSVFLTQEEQITRLEEARNWILSAEEISSDDSMVFAVKTLVLDWIATLPGNFEERDLLLAEAETAANQALNLDNENPYALAYRAEVLIDQQRWDSAEQNAINAVNLDPGLMDTHRVYGYVLESLSRYGQAINEYEEARKINPNFTFLYIKLGQMYRELDRYDEALAHFAQAAEINERLEIDDPLPYRAIAKTYSQQGEFFIAARNMETAIAYDPNNATLFGELGVIYFKSRNYEAALESLHCAVDGCSVQQVIDLEIGVEVETAIVGLDLNPVTALYYYTYSSVLAALHHEPSGHIYCPDAIEIMRELRATYPSDDLIMGIVQENETICSLAGYSP